jgi:glycogen synthase
LRIAFITHEFPPDTGKGGIGTYTYQIANALINLGHEVEVFSASFTREVSDTYKGILTHRIKIQSLDNFRILVVPYFISRHEILPFDLMECPEIGGEAAQIKLHYSSIPLVVRLHTPAVLITRLQNSHHSVIKKLRFVAGSFLRGKVDMGYWSKHDKNQFSDPDYLITEMASIITAPSQAMKIWAMDFWGIKKERIRVVPNPYYPSAELISIPTGTETKTICFLGRLNILKGILTITAAIPAVIKKNPDWKFKFIGADGASPDKSISMKQWMMMKLEKYKDHLEWIEWIDNNELHKYHSKCDIVIIPSLFESFSYVCAEAMGAGRAIIGSNSGGMKELLGDAGLLINPASSRSLNRAINYLICNKEERRKLGESARNRVLNKYNPQVISQRMVEEYLQILNNHNSVPF